MPDTYLCTSALRADRAGGLDPGIWRVVDDIQSGKDNGFLLNLPVADVNELVLEDGEGRLLLLNKAQDQWVLWWG